MKGTVPCIEETVTEFRKVHAWQNTGLDIVNDVLCSTRRCAWCDAQQHKPYGAASSKSWKETK